MVHAASAFANRHSPFDIHSHFAIRYSLLRAILAITAVALNSGCLPNSILITPVWTDQGVKEKELYREAAFAADKIAVIDVDGLILNGRKPQLIGAGEHPVSLLLEQLEAARRDDRVKGVILRINSPGGAVTASQLMYDEIVYFRRATGKPATAVMLDVAASGGYYVACACDEIVAQPTTVTGSIGVIMQTVDLSGTMQKIGVRADAITSGPRKDSGSPLREMRPEERAWFQGMIDDFYERFVAVVRAGRPKLSEAQVRELADGRVFTATQALENGLIDRIATFREAIDGLKARIGADKVRVVSYRRPQEHVPNYYAQAPGGAGGDAGAAAGGTQVNLINIETGDMRLPFSPVPQFLYLWSPGTP